MKSPARDGLSEPTELRLAGLAVGAGLARGSDDMREA